MLLDGQPLLSATISEPYVGRWWADVVLREDAVVGATGTITVGGVEWAGRVASDQLDGSRRKVRLLGSTDDLEAPVLERWYRGSVTALQVLRDIAPSTVDSPALQRVMPQWLRGRGPVHVAIGDIAHELGLHWRTDRQGRVVLHDGSFTDGETDGRMVDDDGASVAYAVDAVDVSPGQTIAGRDVWRLLIMATSQRTTVVLAYQPPPKRTDRWADTADAAVDSQRADGSLDLIAAGRYGVTQVPLYTGLPGVTARVKSGSQTALIRHSPSAPVAVGHRGGTGGCLLGYLVIGVAPGPPAVLLPPQFFDGSPAGLVLALAAQAAMAATPASAFVTPLTTAEVTEQ